MLPKTPEPQPGGVLRPGPDPAQTSQRAQTSTPCEGIRQAEQPQDGGFGTTARALIHSGFSLLLLWFLITFFLFFFFF